MSIEEKIKKWYNEDKLSVSEIAVKLNVTKVYLVKYFELIGLKTKRRGMSEEEIIQSGPSNEELLVALKESNWKLFDTRNRLNIPYRHLEVLMNYHKIPKKHKTKGVQETPEEERNRMEAYLRFQMDIETENESEVN